MTTLRAPLVSSSSSDRLSRTGYFVTLDGIRGVAALAVVLHHLPASFGLPVIPGGYLAVDLFFVLSGFVISHAYDRRLDADLGVANFMRLRFIRLWPLYILGTAGSVALAAAGIVAGVRDDWDWARLVSTAIPAVFMLPYPSSAEESILYPLNAPAWSIFFEILINLVYVAIFARLTRSRILLLIAISAIAVLLFGIHYGEMSGGAQWSTVWVGLARVGFSFFVGVLIRRLHVSGSIGVLGSILPLLIVPIFLLGGNMIGDLIAILAVFPLIIFLGARTEPKWGGALCRFLGNVSYPVYAIHIPLLVFATFLVERGLLPSGPLTGVTFVVVLVGCAWISAELFDKPVRRMLSNLSWRRRQA